MQKRILLLLLFCLLAFTSYGRCENPFGGASIPEGVKRLKPSAPPHMTKATKAYKKIEAELYCHTSINVHDITLSQAMRKISDAHKIPIIVDRRSLEAKGIGPDSRVSLNLRNVPLRTVLALMFRQLKLDYVIKDDVLQIKTIDDVAREPVMLIYVLDSYDERSDDLVGVIQKSLDAKHSDPMPRPVVHLVRNSNSDVKEQDIFVEANRSMHAEVLKILRQFEDAAAP